MSELSNIKLKRRLIEIIRARLAEEIVVGLQGPRSVGKSTLLRQIAIEAGVGVIDLDDPVIRDAVAADPGIFVRGVSPVCIDEYQHVPIILDAIKAELNKEQRPGRFIITGSTRHEALPLAAQTLTGRLHMLTVRPLSQGEIDGVEEDFVERCLVDPGALVVSTPSSTKREEYIDRVVAGGFPMALQRSAGASRNRWFDDYVGQTIERDLLAISQVRQRAKLPLLLSRFAGQTGQLLNVSNAARDVDLEQKTADNYTKLLEAVFLIQRLPAWGSTLRSRAGSAPKIHIVDSGVAARLLRLSAARLSLLQATALTEFGHLLETFVVGEILKQVSWSDNVVGCGHWRTHDGDEVDLILERDDGCVVAFEVKSGSRISGNDLGGLRKLRAALGNKFVGGIVLNTGERSYTPDDRIHVLPIDRLWTPSSAL